MTTLEAYIKSCKQDMQGCLRENRLNIRYIRKPGKQPRIDSSITAGQLSAVRSVLNKTDGSVHPTFGVSLANECIKDENLAISQHNEFPEHDNKVHVEEVTVKQFNAIKNQWLVRRMKPIGVVVSFVDNGGNRLIGYDFNRLNFNKYMSVRKAVMGASHLDEMNKAVEEYEDSMDILEGTEFDYEDNCFEKVPQSMKHAVRNMIEKVNSFQEV